MKENEKCTAQLKSDRKAKEKILQNVNQKAELKIASNKINEQKRKREDDDEKANRFSNRSVLKLQSSQSGQIEITRLKASITVSKKSTPSTLTKTPIPLSNCAAAVITASLLNKESSLSSTLADDGTTLLSSSIHRMDHKLNQMKKVC